MPEWAFFCFFVLSLFFYLCYNQTRYEVKTIFAFDNVGFVRCACVRRLAV